jgi:hypothetical protein
MFVASEMGSIFLKVQEGFVVILGFRYGASVCILLGMVYSTTAVFAQTENDLKTMEKARSIYLTGPIPSSISCEVALDWDGFFQRMKIEQTDETKAKLQKFKDIKISVVSLDEDHTDIKIDAPDTAAGLTDGLRQQLKGFFQIYWSQAYGKLVTVKQGDAFELATVPEGYVLKMTRGSTNVSVEMDKTYRVTRTNVDSPQMTAVAAPGFVAGEDGLLRLRTFDETVNFGATKMVIDINLDYQKVGGYDIPQHIHMGLPGSYSFDYTLGGCEVKGDNATAPTAKTEK